MSMTKKDYQLIARALNKAYVVAYTDQKDIIKMATEYLCAALKNDNSTFQESIFRKAVFSES